MSLKELAKKGFRTKQIVVPEWDDVTVIVREPMHLYFSRYAKSLNDALRDDNLSELEKDKIVIESEVKLFITVLSDEQDELVFNEQDVESLCQSYGPIHTRLLNEAVDLMGLGNRPIKDAEKK